MRPEDFVIESAYRQDVQSRVMNWCHKHRIWLNVRTHQMNKVTIARVITEMNCEEAFFDLEGVHRPGWAKNSHDLYSDGRAAKIPPSPGNVTDLIREKERFEGISVSRYSRKYSNPDQIRRDEDDEQ
jgi:hypothetical protein